MSPMDDTRYDTTESGLKTESKFDAGIELQPFPDERRWSPAWSRERHIIRHPVFVAIVAGISCMVVFMLGFSTGRSEMRANEIMAASATKELSDITRLMTDFESAQRPEHGPSKASIALPGTSSAGHSSIFDVFRSLLPVDLLQEYGLNHNDLSLFPNPLREQICIVNSDTRKWSPQDHKDLTSLDILHWGYINHYLYAKMHGYTFKHIQAPEQKGFWNTWVKVKEQYRMTMEDTCKFVIMLDADIIFKDLRVPLEALLSHWNITEDIALAAGIDIDATKDLYGRTQLNTGFVITQRTPLLPSLMQDWIDCPTDLKYKNCSRWKTEFSHEQAAISNHIRDDPMYKDHIRTLAVEEIHLGGYLKHYWDREKPKLENATKDAILDRFLPAV